MNTTRLGIMPEPILSQESECNLAFKPITFESLPEIEPFLHRQTYRTCDFSIGGIYMWIDYFGYEYCICHDTLFIKGGEENNLQNTAFAIPVGNWYITASTDSFFYALQLILTALAAVSCLYFLSFTTPMPDILEVLRKLHCPGLLIELMLLIYRFIFILLDTASAISTSQNCRLGNKDYRTSLKSFGLLGSVLMIRAITRSNKLYDAMEARCYDGRIRVLSENRPPRKKIIAAIAVFDTALFIFAIWRKFFS